MARASNVYIVHPIEDPLNILAVFTVKYESQLWAERHHGLDKVGRYRMRDAGSWGWVGQVDDKIPAPWEIENGKESLG